MTEEQQNPEHETEQQNQPANDLPPPGETPDNGLESLKTKIDDLQKAADASRDQLLRKAAEFENYKRRAENEYQNLIRNANEGLLLSLLPVVDDFYRMMKSGATNRDSEAFLKGVELVYAKFMKTLQLQGVTPFESAGKPFDVGYHDALLQLPRADVPPHTVIEEVERGYMLNDKVLRHAKVVVSSEPVQEPTGSSDTPPTDAGQS